MADIIRFIGRYHGHAIRILQDGHLWRIAFDPFAVPGLAFGKEMEETVLVPWKDNTTYRSADAAQRTALTLAQEKLSSLGLLKEITWQKVHE